MSIGTSVELGRLHLRMPTTAGTDPVIHFSDANGEDCGSIDLNASANTVAYTTSSDYRLKENVNYSWDATTELKKLKPAKFNFKADADTTVEGFLAHEVSDIVPIAVTGEKDAVDEDGNMVVQGIDQSKLVPLMVKTIQELEARIKTLEDA
jgi:viroplasmin and RNaseH domain-containing protein